MMNIKGYIWILLVIVLGIKSCQLQDDHSLFCFGNDQDFTKMHKDVEEITIIGAKTLKLESLPDMSSVKSMTVNSDVLEDIEREFFSKFLVNAEKSSLTLTNIPIKLEKKHLYRLNRLKILIIQNLNDIADDAFDDLTSLEDLTIVNYSKDRLPASIETLIANNLKKLSIQSSNIEHFPWNTFNYFIEMKNPGFIDLINSPIKCQDKAFLNMFKNNQANIMNEKLLINGMCSEPRDFKNKQVKEISTDDVIKLMSIKSVENIDVDADASTTKASTEIIAVSIAISILLILLIAGLIAFKMCRGRNSHRDFQKSSSHTQQIESNYEPIRNDLMI